MYPGGRRTMIALVEGARQAPRMTYEQWAPGKREEAEESDIIDNARWAAKSLATGKKVIGFKRLPEEFQQMDSSQSFQSVL